MEANSDGKGGWFLFFSDISGGAGSLLITGRAALFPTLSCLLPVLTADRRFQSHPSALTQTPSSPHPDFSTLTATSGQDPTFPPS